MHVHIISLRSQEFYFVTTAKLLDHTNIYAMHLSAIKIINACN